MRCHCKRGIDILLTLKEKNDKNVINHNFVSLDGVLKTVYWHIIPTCIAVLEC